METLIEWELSFVLALEKIVRGFTCILWRFREWRLLMLRKNRFEYPALRFFDSLTEFTPQLETALSPPWV